jgi:outer membrane protein FlgP
MPPLLPIGRIPLAATLLLVFAGCATMPPRRAVDALPADATHQTAMLAQTKDRLDQLDDGNVFERMAPVPAALIGRGFAQVAGQPGATMNERRLLAMRAARLDALRDLTEQVHGIRISSESLLRDAVLRNDRLVAQVEGTLRGARTLSIEPKGDDGYSVVMQLDADAVAYIVRAVGAGS